MKKSHPPWQPAARHLSVDRAVDKSQDWNRDSLGDWRLAHRAA